MCCEKSVLYILFMYSVSMIPEPPLWFKWSPTFFTLMFEGFSTISAVKIFTENMWIIIHELCVYVSRNSPLVWLRSHIHHEHFLHVSRSPPLVWMMSHILYSLRSWLSLGIFSNKIRNQRHPHSALITSSAAFSFLMMTFDDSWWLWR